MGYITRHARRSAVRYTRRTVLRATLPSIRTRKTSRRGGGGGGSSRGMRANRANPILVFVVGWGFIIGVFMLVYVLT